MKTKNESQIKKKTRLNKNFLVLKSSGITKSLLKTKKN